MTNCEKFQDAWDAYLDNRMEASGKVCFEAHANACASCQEALNAWRSFAPLMEKDRDALGKEPTPYFFNTQFYDIRDRIEDSQKGWWVRFMPWWKPAFSKAATALALFVMLATSWTIFRTGTVPFAANDMNSKAMEEVLSSDDSLFLVFDMLFSDDSETLTLLF